MNKLRAHLLWPFVMLASLIIFTGVVFADTPVDPTTNPTDALQQFWDAVVSKRWGIVAVVGTMLFVAFVRFISPRIHGTFGTWVNSSRVSAVLALLSGGLAAIATQLMKGGAFSLQLVAYGFGFGVAAIGGYNAFWDILFPADKKTPPNGQTLSPPTPPVTKVAAMLPLVLITFAFSACTPCTSAATSPTCARKILTGVDALDGAAARISTRWLKSCADSARALKDAGKLNEADAAFTACEATGSRMVEVTKTTEDSTQTASDGVDVGEAAGQKDYGSILAPVLSFVTNLKKVFADAGVSIPTVGIIPGVL